MNLMDLVPIDWIPSLAQWVGSLMGHDPHHVYFKLYQPQTQILLWVWRLAYFS